MRGLVVALVLVLVTAPVLAQPPEPAPVRLEYTGPATCASAATFRNLVASRMRGRDPFTTDALRRLVVVLHRRGSDFAADASMYNAAGVRRYHRQLDAPDCTELAESTALVVSLWLTPVVLPTATPPPKPPEPPPVEPEPEPKKAEPPAEPVRVPIVPRVDVGMWLDFGLAPRPLVGVKADAGFRRGPLSVRGELRWDPRATATTASPFVGSVSTTLFVGGLVGCMHHDWHVMFAGCIVGEVGWIQRSVGGTSTGGTGQLAGLEQADVYAAGGAEVRVEVPLHARVDVHAVGDLLGARKLGDVSASANGGMTVGLGSTVGLAGGVGAGVGVSF
jgi:hypothetical protein